MTHASMEAPARVEAGIGEGLLRLSVGIEAAGDLEADLERALERAGAAASALAADGFAGASALAADPSLAADRVAVGQRQCAAGSEVA